MDEKERTQETQPAEGEPITIPVPTREAIDDAIAKVSRPVPPKPDARHARRPVVDWLLSDDEEWELSCTSCEWKQSGTGGRAVMDAAMASHRCSTPQ